MSNIKELSISHNTSFGNGDVRSFMYTVKNWNQIMCNQKRYTEVYTLGNGSMIDEPRQRGYVVEKHHKQGGKRSHFWLSPKKALEDYYSPNFH